MTHFITMLHPRERAARIEDDLMTLGQRAGLSILRENASSLRYREAAVRGRYRVKLMEKHLWRTE